MTPTGSRRTRNENGTSADSLHRHHISASTPDLLPSAMVDSERPRPTSADSWKLSAPIPAQFSSPLRQVVLPLASSAGEDDNTPVGTKNRFIRGAKLAPIEVRDQPMKTRSLSSSPPIRRRTEDSGRTRVGARPTSPYSDTDIDESRGLTSWRNLIDTPPRAPHAPTPPKVTSPVASLRLSPRKAKAKAKRPSLPSHRRMLSATSSDSGFASPPCDSPLVSTQIPDILPSTTTTDADAPYFPRMTSTPSRPPRTPSPVLTTAEMTETSARLAALEKLLRGPTPPPRLPEPEHTEQPSIEIAEEEAAQTSMNSVSPTLRSGSVTPELYLRPSTSRKMSDAPVSPIEAIREKDHPKIFRSPSPVEEPAVRHSTFYMEDEMVTLRVENTLFRVHRYFLERDSAHFRELFAHALDAVVGKSDAHALRLPNVSRREFECLLRFLYHGAGAPGEWSVLTLVLLLSTAASLGFARARAHAITELERAEPELDPVERVFLAEKYGIAHWRRPAYVALCGRAHPLEDAEAEVLGLQTTARLARAREAVLEEKLAMWRRVAEGKAGAKEIKEDVLVERVVDEVFRLNR